MKKEIELGDKVDVYLGDNKYLFDCEVLYIPQILGDSWHLLNNAGELIYVQIFKKIVLRRNEEWL